MILDGVLSQASSGLDAIAKQLAVVSQNVGNAGTPGYVREDLALQSATADGDGMGVRAGVATRTVDNALQSNLFAADADVASGQARQAALATIDAASGAPGSGQDLAGLVGALRDGFSTLENDPANTTQQRQVVNLAGSLARGVNALGAAIAGQRQLAQDSLRDDVTQANAALANVGRLSIQIIGARQRGQSTADLEDQRDTAMQTATALTGAKFLPQPNGDMLAASGGTILPTHGATTPPTGPLSLATATLSPTTPPAAVPPLLVSGATAPIAGGTIGAKLALRDTELPALQTGLDGFAQALAQQFASQGLTLFTDASGAVPSGAGAAAAIQVDPAVQSTPRMVRDGAGPAGAAGDTTLIAAVLGGVLATGTGTVAAQAADFVSGAAQRLSTATDRLATDQAVQTSLSTKLDAGTGVSIDTEMAHMVALQNSYGANARVISAVQTIWTQLLASVQ